VPAARTGVAYNCAFCESERAGMPNSGPLSRCARAIQASDPGADKESAEQEAHISGAQWVGLMGSRIAALSSQMFPRSRFATIVR
jgi:hypothetical protein